MLKYGHVLLAFVVLQQCCICMASLEQLLDNFKVVVGVLVPPEKAAKLKEDVESARPCLSELVSKLGEPTIEKVLKGIMPLAMKCGTEFLRKTELSDADKKTMFVDCISEKSGTLMAQLSPSEQQAMAEARTCVKALFEDAV